MTRIFKSIEHWASESDDRVRLLMILIWATFGIVVVLAILITAWIMLPPDFTLF
jgi:phage shock protein PspC (stress-responsive transcriptional regulator)